MICYLSETSATTTAAPTVTTTTTKRINNRILIKYLSLPTPVLDRVRVQLHHSHRATDLNRTGSNLGFARLCLRSLDKGSRKKS